MRLAVSFALAFGVASAASAQVLYDNIGTYVWDSSSTATGWGSAGGSFTGQMFTATATGTVSTIDVALQMGQGSTSPSAGTLQLWTATPSETLGSQLGSTISFSSVPAHNSGSILTVSGPNVSLTAGSKYWLLVTPDAGNGFAWRYTDPATMGRGASGNAAGVQYWSNQPMGAFRVNAVPEPSTMAILSLGILPLLRRRFPRK